MFRVGGLVVDLERRAVQSNGKDIHLTPTEYDLLKVLMQHKGKIMTRQMLLKEVWGTGYGAEAHYLHVYIGQLRRKIEPDPASPRLILTVPGVGHAPDLNEPAALQAIDAFLNELPERLNRSTQSQAC